MAAAQGLTCQHWKTEGPGTLCLSSSHQEQALQGGGPVNPKPSRQVGLLYLSHDGAQRKRVSSTSAGYSLISFTRGLSSLCSSDSLAVSHRWMYLTMAGTCRGHRDTWRVARAATSLASPEVLPFPPHWAGPQRLREPSRPSLGATQFLG